MATHFNDTFKRWPHISMTPSKDGHTFQWHLQKMATHFNDTFKRWPHISMTHSKDGHTFQWHFKRWPHISMTPSKDYHTFQWHIQKMATHFNETFKRWPHISMTPSKDGHTFQWHLQKFVKQNIFSAGHTHICISHDAKQYMVCGGEISQTVTFLKTAESYDGVNTTFTCYSTPSFSWHFCIHDHCTTGH
jgi:hypothetical protein